MTLLSEFNPKLTYSEIEYLTGDRMSLQGKKIENTSVYNLVRELTDQAFPSYEDRYDRKWFDFYLPLRRSGKMISLPFGIVEYKKEFFIGFQGLGHLQVKRGRAKVEEEYQTLFKEALRFVPLIKKTKPKILEKTVPHDIRTGKILGKYIMEKLMPKKEGKKILPDYQRHLEKELKVVQISLNDYLETAAVCYQAAYEDKTKGLSPPEMYKRWADGRDCGMLEIKDKKSKRAYAYWLKHKSHCGGHPFEIIFSWHEHGIHLYPSDTERPYYMLEVTNYAYAKDFIEMVNALIKQEIPFQAGGLEEVVNYLSGETYFRVNEFSEHMFHYIPSQEYKRLYFRHIEWDELKVPGWKKKESQKEKIKGN